MPQGVSPETLIRAPNGLPQARDLPRGNGSRAEAGDDPIPPSTPAPVSAHTTRGPGVCITADGGLSLAAALGQRVAVLNEACELEFRLAADIRVGDNVVLDDGRTIPAWRAQPPTFLRPASRKGRIKLRLDNQLTMHMALFLGWLTANGYVNNIDMRITNHEADRLATEAMAQYLRTQGLYATVRPRNGSRAIDLQASSVEFASFLQTNDCAKELRNGEHILRHAAAAHIPRPIRESPLAHVGAFLAGYFAGDGTAGAAGSGFQVRATSVSLRLAQEITVVLRHMGIRVQLHRYTAKPTWKPLYTMSISGAASLRRFAEQVGFATPRKMHRLEAHIAGHGIGTARGDSIYQRAAVEELWQKSRHLPNLVRKSIGKYRRSGVLNLDFLRQLLTKHPELKDCKAARLLDSTLTFGRVVNVEPVADREWVALDSPSPVFANAFIIEPGRA